MANDTNSDKYITIKELSYELSKMGLPSSREFLHKIKIRGAPFICNRAKLQDIINWLVVSGNDTRRTVGK